MDSVIATTANTVTQTPSLLGTPPEKAQSSSAQTLSSANASWYTPGTDFGSDTPILHYIIPGGGNVLTRGSSLYAVALDACRTSKARLSKLNLTVEEKQLLIVPPTDASSLISKLNFIVEDRQNKTSQAKWQKRTSRFFLGFSQVVDKTSALVTPMLPQSPEYTVTFGILALLFKAVVTKKDREEALMAYLETLAAKLPVAEFYKSAFPTTAIKIAVANIYSETMKLLDEALVYYRSPRLGPLPTNVLWCAQKSDRMLRPGRLVDAVILPFEAKYQKCISQVDAEVRRLTDLKDIAHEAQAIDIHEMVTQTGKAVASMYEEFRSVSGSLCSSLESLDQRFLRLDTKMDRMRTFEMIRYMQELEKALFSSADAQYWDPDEALGRLARQGFRLSPKDHWDNNGILEKLVEWSRVSADFCPLLWIGGQSGNQDPWVTELSLDIVRGLLPQQINILYVFCSDIASTTGHFTPTDLVRLLIAQLLKLHPQLAYEDPLCYSVLRLQNALGFDGLWQILEDLTSNLTGLYIVIDRIEECGSDGDDLKSDLLPNLARLVHGLSGSRAIVTSVHEIPTEAFEYELEEMVDDIYIET
ncbi:hypothetical protein PG993_010513 [Apiospora rasikravindrae]|uniref:Uncharacterized protein n=1 Tax=Apiospora rasikravindrae TaxID=990691 RepID=A0ABR1SMG2_9PEZI